MTRITQEQLRQLPSFSELTKWNVQFLELPTLNLPFDVSTYANLRAETSTVPKKTNQKIEIRIRGQRIFQNGLDEWDGTLTMTFLETDDAALRQLITAWTELAQDSNTGKQAAKSDLEASLRLTMLNKEDEEIYEFILKGVFIEDSDIGSLDGSSSDVLRPSITFSYDRAIPNAI